MKTVTKIETEVENLGFAIWDKANEALIPLEDMTTAEAAKELKCSPELVEALSAFVESIIWAVKEDLETIWERLDKLEV